MTYYTVNYKNYNDPQKASKKAKELHNKCKLYEYTEHWICEFGYPHDTDLRPTLKYL